MTNDAVRKANAVQDDVAALNVLRHPDTFNMTQQEVCIEAELVNGVRAFSVAKISRFETDPHSTRAVIGLQETAIARLFYTPARVARHCQEWELKLRKADFDDKPLKSLLRGAEEFARDTRGWIAARDKVPFDGYADHGERNLDRAALDSLCQQINLYRARSGDVGQKKRFYAQSLHCGANVLVHLRDAVAEFPNAERGDLILANRSSLNSFFGEFRLDELNDEQTTLPRTRQFARTVATRQILLTGFKVAVWTNDPRIALYLGEAACLAHPGDATTKRSAKVRIELPASTPIETAARLVYLSKKLDRHEATPVREWSPNWLSGGWVAELEPAIALIEEDERNHIMKV